MNISAPSYIIPGTWWDNIQYIDAFLPEITNIELLFFIYNDETLRILRPEEDKILGYSGRLTFTIHLPDPLFPEHEELVEKTSVLAVHWIIHPPETGSEEPFRKMLDAWRQRWGNRFLLENLIGRNHPWFLRYTDWPLCLDTGHALLRKHSPLLYYNRFKERIGEIHIHDLSNGQDHSSLSEKSLWLKNFMPTLKDFSGFLNIELFSEKEITESLTVLNILQKGQRENSPTI